MLTFIWNRIRALTGTVVLLTVIGLIFVGYRILSYSQSDDEARLQGKQGYMALVDKLKGAPLRPLNQANPRDCSPAA